MNNLHSSTIVMYDVLRLITAHFRYKIRTLNFFVSSSKVFHSSSHSWRLEISAIAAMMSTFWTTCRSIRRQTNNAKTKKRGDPGDEISFPVLPSLLSLELWTALWTPSTGSFPRSLWGTKTRRKISQKRRVWLTSFATSNLKYVSI